MDADAHEVDYPALANWHRFRFRQGALTGLDRAQHEVLLHRGARRRRPSKSSRSAAFRTTRSSSASAVSPTTSAPPASPRRQSRSTRPPRPNAFTDACWRRRFGADARRGRGEARARRHRDHRGRVPPASSSPPRSGRRRSTHAVYGLDHLDPAHDIRLTLIEAAPRILPQL